MRTRFSRGGDDAGDFSVAFGDMMFGMLFIFFLFALVLVFNRPDVDAYQREENKLLRKASDADKANQRLEVTVRDLKKEIERLNDAVAKNRGSDELANAEYRKKVLEADALRKELDEVRRKGARSGKDTVKMSDALDRRAREVEEWRRNYEDAINRIGEIEAERIAAAQLFNSCKEILRNKGLAEVLAEVEAMESGPGKNPPEPPPPPLNMYKLYAKLFGRDEVSLKVRKGDALVSEANFLSADDVGAAAADVMARFTAESASYPEGEKGKYTPKLFLMSNPEATYGSVQDFMKTVSKAMPIQIIPWAAE